MVALYNFNMASLFLPMTINGFLQLLFSSSLCIKTTTTTIEMSMLFTSLCIKTKQNNNNNKHVNVNMYVVCINKCDCGFPLRPAAMFKFTQYQ